MANFDLVRPSPLIQYVPWSKTASTAYTVGELVEADGDGAGVGFDKADATSTNHIGLVTETVASGDSDYASTTRENILVDIHGYYEADVGTGSADSNDEGNLADLDANGQVDVTASSVDVFLIHKVLGTTRVGGWITKWAYIF